MNRSISIRVEDASAVGEARRQAAVVASRVGLQETACGKASILATEAANNLLKHATRGEILLRADLSSSVPAVEILAVDRGPGIADVSRCLRDGYSTAGSPGTGLGAMQRLSDTFDLYSMPGKGTIVLCKVRAKGAGQGSPLEIGAVCLPLQQGHQCGDSWSTLTSPNRAQILVVDGLGHGPLAAEAADEAVRVFSDNPGLGPGEMVRTIHGPLRATRGASLAVADIWLDRSSIQYAGIGNIASCVLSQNTTRSMISHNGIVGHELHNVAEFGYAWPRDALLVMNSDGLLTRWKLDDYPGLMARDPSVIAAVLYRDFARGRDDVTVVVCRHRGSRVV